jgi:hypothetical protein
MYVSDTRIWKIFYKTCWSEISIFSVIKVDKLVIARMYSKKPYILPVNPHTPVQESKEVMGKRVTPVETVKERAKRDLREEIDKNVPYFPANSIKNEKDLKSIRPLSATKKRTRKRTVPKVIYATGTNHKTKETYLDYNICTPREYRNMHFKDDGIS